MSRIWKFSESILSSLESCYHSAPSQQHLQVETETDLLDTLILEDVKERLRQPNISDSQLFCLGSLVSSLENPSEIYQVGLCLYSVL